MKKDLNAIRERRKRRVKMSLRGNGPRLSVFRSNRHLWVQLIDDQVGRTLVSASTKELGKTKETKTAQATELGKTFYKKAKTAGFERAVLDRGSYKYHGRLKALVESLRQNGFKI